MHWTQVYDPLGHWWLSTLVAALPILVLFGLLGGLKIKPHWCASAGALTAILVAVAFFRMPLTLAAMSFAYGVAFGLLKIAWIVLAAVYLYDISVETGQFEIMKESVPGILVVGISFALTQFFWSNHVDSNLVDIMGGVVSIIATIIFLRLWKPRKIWRFDYDEQAAPLLPPAERVADQVGGKWAADKFDGYIKVRSYAAGQVLKAWMPFGILSLFVLLWGLPSIKLIMNQATTPAFRVRLADGKLRPGPPGWDVPYLHNAVYRAAPVVDKPTAESARYEFNWLSATGTGCFFAAIVAGLFLGLSPLRLIRVFWRTLVRMRLAVIAISFMLGLGFVTRYAGLDAVLGLAFTRTGWLYPFFGTFLGWLGVALTGSDTSSNALFGSLQRITSQQLGIDPVLMCAANSAGGVMGKMVDAQSITIATAATEQVGNEGTIFRFVVWHSVALGAIVGIIVMLYAYVFSYAVPHGLTFVK